jgi:hypothetical protein
MKEIIATGPSAQDALIAALSNRKILDQVIILLGAIGDERAVPHIINAMVPREDYQQVGDAIHINLCASLALTNITVADVIWHHGGGIPGPGPANPKQAWVDWWEKNEKTFTVKGITTSRRYSNYPNYGIHRVEQRQEER